MLTKKQWARMPREEQQRIFALAEQSVMNFVWFEDRHLSVKELIKIRSWA